MSPSRFCLLYLLFSSYCWNSVLAENILKVTSSADPQSNAAHSFIIVPANKLIPSGIKRDTQKNKLALQIPFIVALEKPVDKNKKLQWRINIPSRKFGKLQILSHFKGEYKKTAKGLIWQSLPLGNNVYERDKLVFRPRPPKHRPTIYKKGRGAENRRRKYGGGTRNIDDNPYNPKFRYEVSLNIIDDTNKKTTYHRLIEMDNKDMIRQEYINHYGIKRYGRGDNGKLPVPTRDEITQVPARIKDLTGNPLTESKYGLLINDGMSELARHIAAIYESSKKQHQKNPLKDKNGKPLPTPDSKLWLSGGWRNPERNEWYSNALNGIHQRGGAIDVIVTAPPGDINAAIAYWVLWDGLNKNRDTLKAFWQLETHGRPMRTDEFKNDIEPENGIPDAFDKADHLHANIKYDEP